jgi:hypothetical protein
VRVRLKGGREEEEADTSHTECERNTAEDGDAHAAGREVQSLRE